MTDRAPAATPDIPVITLKGGADRRVRAGHLWIFSNELKDGFQKRQPGEAVEIRDSHGAFLGMGTVNPHSLIAARLFTRERVAIDEAFLRRRLEAAIALRRRLLGAGETTCRLVYSEADGLPGLIVDRFGDVFVLQSSTAGMDRLQGVVVSILEEMFEPKAIVAANDMRSREFEGLPAVRELVSGDLEGTHEFQQDGIGLMADPLAGQKTGYFLDQRWNRRLLTGLIQPGDRVLDLFCYTGGFGLYALQAGAGQVTFVDASAPALEIVTRAVERNGWAERAIYRNEDIFPYLKELSETYDVVVLDPPAVAKARTKVPAALRAYRDLNARAMAAVQPGGLIATASCSGLVERTVWREVLREAALKAGRRLRIVAQGSQGPDHPVLAAMPETEYLKFAIGVVS